MKVLHPCSTSALVNFSPGTIDCLWNGAKVKDCYSFAGVSADNTFGWFAKGCALEVFDISNVRRLAAWNFGAAIKDTQTFITAICEYVDYSHSNGPVSNYSNLRTKSVLVVATTSLSPKKRGGSVCLFDIRKSAVVCAIDVHYEVTSIEAICAAGLDRCPVLGEQLQYFDGIIALGTQCGQVYLIDACLGVDPAHQSTELNPVGLDLLLPTVTDVESRRADAARRRRHLAIVLDSHTLADATRADESFGVSNATSSGRSFYYTSPDRHRTPHILNQQDVYVSCLKFIKYTGSLVVAFNFGAFQIWCLRNLNLDFSSPYQENLPVVSHVSFQLPENDPRKCCFLWVVRGPGTSDPTAGVGTAYMSLFQLVYTHKPFFEGFGFLHQEMEHIWIRLEHALSGDPYIYVHSHSGSLNDAVQQSQAGARVFACYTLEKTKCLTPQLSPDFDSSTVIEGIIPDTSLLVIAWEARSVDEGSNSVPKCFLSIFDLNSYYNAWHPSEITYSGVDETCPYWCVYSLDDMMQNLSPDSMLALHINQESVYRLQSKRAPITQELLQPSALSFNVCGIAESGIVRSSFRGVQQQLLFDIERGGPNILFDPETTYNACRQAGLLPGLESSAQLSSLNIRESLLSLALENGLISFVTACIKQLATAEFHREGCTLKLILDWAWKELAIIKKTIDDTCVPLFDHSRQGLSEDDIESLSQCQVSNAHLEIIFESLCAQSHTATEQGAQELQSRRTISRLIQMYLNVILWMYSVHLLPEESSMTSTDDDVLAVGCIFPAAELRKGYNNRRASINGFSLLIDRVLLEHGTGIIELFRRECNQATYPPDSFYVVANMYLVPAVTERTKHIVFLYLLKDIALTVPRFTDSDGLQALCDAYCHTFDVSIGVGRFVHAMWLLDHSYMNDAVSAFLDVRVAHEIAPSQHNEIVQALLCQGQERLALRYMTVKGAQSLDVKLQLIVLLANRLTTEAFQYQRILRMNSVDSEDDLMMYIVVACLENNCLSDLLHLPLTPDEEKRLVSILKCSADSRCQNLLVMYYLNHSRITEALQVHGTQHGPPYFSTHAGMRMIMSAYERALPPIKQKLLGQAGDVDAMIYQRQRLAGVHYEYVRPKPLSAALNQQKAASMAAAAPLQTKATLLELVLGKVRELELPKARTQEVAVASHLFSGPITPMSSRKSSVNDVFSSVAKSAGIPTPSGRRTTIGGYLLDFDQSGFLAPLPQKQNLPINQSTSNKTTSIHEANASTTKVGVGSAIYSGVFAILQTPPVKHYTGSALSSIRKQALTGASAVQPQSILSVRRSESRSIRRSLTAVPEATRLAFNEDMSPANRNHSCNEDEVLTRQKTSSTKLLSTSSGVTTKTLRFNLPDHDLSLESSSTLHDASWLQNQTEFGVESRLEEDGDIIDENMAIGDIEEEVAEDEEEARDTQNDSEVTFKHAVHATASEIRHGSDDDKEAAVQNGSEMDEEIVKENDNDMDVVEAGIINRNENTQMSLELRESCLVPESFHDNEEENEELNESFNCNSNQYSVMEKNGEEISNTMTNGSDVNRSWSAADLRRPPLSSARTSPVQQLSNSLNVSPLKDSSGILPVHLSVSQSLLSSRTTCITVYGNLMVSSGTNRHRVSCEGAARNEEEDVRESGGSSHSTNKRKSQEALEESEEESAEKEQSPVRKLLRLASPFTIASKGMKRTASMLPDQTIASVDKTTDKADDAMEKKPTSSPDTTLYEVSQKQNIEEVMTSGVESHKKSVVSPFTIASVGMKRAASMLPDQTIPSLDKTTDKADNAVKNKLTSSKDATLHETSQNLDMDEVATSENGKKSDENRDHLAINADLTLSVTVPASDEGTGLPPLVVICDDKEEFPPADITKRLRGRQRRDITVLGTEMPQRRVTRHRNSESDASDITPSRSTFKRSTKSLPRETGSRNSLADKPSSPLRLSTGSVSDVAPLTPSKRPSRSNKDVNGKSDVADVLTPTRKSTRNSNAAINSERATVSPAKRSRSKGSPVANVATTINATPPMKESAITSDITQRTSSFSPTQNQDQAVSDTAHQRTPIRRSRATDVSVSDVALLTPTRRSARLTPSKPLSSAAHLPVSDVLKPGNTLKEISRAGKLHSKEMPAVELEAQSTTPRRSGRLPAKEALSTDVDVPSPSRRAVKSRSSTDVVASPSSRSMVQHRPNNLDLDLDSIDSTVATASSTNIHNLVISSSVSMCSVVMNTDLIKPMATPSTSKKNAASRDQQQVIFTSARRSTRSLGEPLLDIALPVSPKRHGSKSPQGRGRSTDSANSRSPSTDVNSRKETSISVEKVDVMNIPIIVGSRSSTAFDSPIKTSVSVEKMDVMAVKVYARNSTFVSDTDQSTVAVESPTLSRPEDNIAYLTPAQCMVRSRSGRQSIGGALATLGNSKWAKPRKSTSTVPDSMCLHSDDGNSNRTVFKKYQSSCSVTGMEVSDEPSRLLPSVDAVEVSSNLKTATSISSTVPEEVNMMGLPSTVNSSSVVERVYTFTPPAHERLAILREETLILCSPPSIVSSYSFSPPNKSTLRGRVAQQLISSRQQTPEVVQSQSVDQQQMSPIVAPTMPLVNPNDNIIDPTIQPVTNPTAFRNQPSALPVHRSEFDGFHTPLLAPSELLELPKQLLACADDDVTDKDSSTKPLGPSTNSAHQDDDQSACQDVGTSKVKVNPDNECLTNPDSEATEINAACNATSSSASTTSIVSQDMGKKKSKKTVASKRAKRMPAVDIDTPSQDTANLLTPPTPHPVKPSTSTLTISQASSQAGGRRGTLRKKKQEPIIDWE